ncbi:MAG: Protoheme IX farnesyltransferase [Mycoplasmataceae bacterium]|nr:MAG: Protoheme IX farnesyltransferase [Mycoplasmataceae bacterium]
MFSQKPVKKHTIIWLLVAIFIQLIFFTPWLKKWSAVGLLINCLISIFYLLYILKLPKKEGDWEKQWNRSETWYWVFFIGMSGIVMLFIGNYLK